MDSITKLEKLEKKAYGVRMNPAGRPSLTANGDDERIISRVLHSSDMVILNAESDFIYFAKVMLSATVVETLGTSETFTFPAKRRCECICARILKLDHAFGCIFCKFICISSILHGDPQAAVFVCSIEIENREREFAMDSITKLEKLEKKAYGVRTNPAGRPSLTANGDDERIISRVLHSSDMVILNAESDFIYFAKVMLSATVVETLGTSETFTFPAKRRLHTAVGLKFFLQDNLLERHELKESHILFVCRFRSIATKNALSVSICRCECICARILKLDHAFGCIF
ncbi:hypothetical protein HHK36_006274 [Tetracentron sinense]|uniref:Uncharacterized protein n=1 Tax=Tetracentron sinense TaxID=13715 RepID=A0A835DK31_TETSI|nr:hypothetical protein HHK36_006274 [Tetracentron sinense]